MQSLDPDVHDQFQEWAQSDENTLDLLWEEVAPHMAERERARRAILLSAASPADKVGRRGRVHALLVGPPGTGKTELRNWVRYSIRNSVGIGPKSSEAGLKGDASGEEITPGALNMSHGGMLCIEELDKFSKADRDALYEAMSEGEYDINQGEIRQTFPAEVRTVATANTLDKFKPAIKDRFDFIIECEEYDADATMQVTEKLTDGFLDAFAHGETDVADVELLPEYLRWIEDYEPGVEEGVGEAIKRMQGFLIKQMGATGNIRGKMSYNRIAYTIARLNRRDMTAADFVTAVDLKHPAKDWTPALEAVARDDWKEAMQKAPE